MNVIPRAYRTTCIPTYKAETLAAMQEARDIMSGKVEAKRYKTAAEMHADILAEAED